MIDALDIHDIRMFFVLEKLITVVLLLCDLMLVVMMINLSQYIRPSGASVFVTAKTLKWNIKVATIRKT